MFIKDIENLVQVRTYRRNYKDGRHDYITTLVYGMPMRLHALHKLHRSKSLAQKYGKDVIQRCERWNVAQEKQNAIQTTMV